MSRLPRSLVVLLAVLAISIPTALTALNRPADAAPAAFTHPGVLLDRAQLDHMRQQVQAGAQPQKAAYDAMRASSFASLSYTATPRAVVECGSYSNPNYGCTDEREDAVAAYTHALLWYITRDTRHAQKAIQIMDAWSAVIRDHTNSNAMLQTGWSGASFSRAAELIKHTYTGSWAQLGRFSTMLRNVYLSEILNGAGCKNGNWELIMLDAAIGIAVFLDDRAEFDKAVGIWRGRLPGYVYLTSRRIVAEGTVHLRLKDTRDELIAYWHGQSRFEHGPGPGDLPRLRPHRLGLRRRRPRRGDRLAPGPRPVRRGEAPADRRDVLPHPLRDRHRGPVLAVRWHREEGLRPGHRGGVQPLRQPDRPRDADHPALHRVQATGRREPFPRLGDPDPRRQPLTPIIRPNSPGGSVLVRPKLPSVHTFVRRTARGRHRRTA